jgi:short-subunit dehydrogenase
VVVVPGSEPPRYVPVLPRCGACMLARGRGRIINVASAAGEVAVPYMSAYNASKTAVIRFTETLASELREHGIPVFAITPGPVRTAMTEELIISEAGKRWLPWCEQLFENRQDVSVEPATTLVVFLSTGARDHLSGKLLSAKERRLTLLAASSGFSATISTHSNCVDLNLSAGW